ncbi:hypothetical protein TNCV_4250061 [Trichonephila clavipes]|nr:hypothetical protein TNCV_4250061 [Trichonephila clavipes]
MIQDYKPLSRRLSFIRPRFSCHSSPFSPRSDPSLLSRCQVLLPISCVSFDLLPEKFDSEVTGLLVKARSRAATLRNFSISRLELIDCNIGTRLSEGKRNQRTLSDSEKKTYVTGSLNPSDLHSRGCRVEVLSKSRYSPPGSATAYQLQHHSINRQAVNRVAKNDAYLALSPTFHNVSIKSSL